jgi:hypothetical protein
MLLSVMVSRQLAPEPNSSDSEKKAYALFLQRPTPVTSRSLQAVFEKVEDPAPGQRASEFLMRVVQECELHGFKIDTQGAPERLDAGAVLYVAAESVGESAFSCMTNKIRYPFLTFEMVPQNCHTDQSEVAHHDIVFGPAPVCIEGTR